MKTRYAVTYIDEEYGLRKLARTNWGINHFDTPEGAFSHLKDMKENNSLELLESIYGKPGVESMGVSPIECYDHGDAISIFVKKEALISCSDAQGL